MRPSHIKILLAVLAALGIGTGSTLMTDGGFGSWSGGSSNESGSGGSSNDNDRGGSVSLDPSKVENLGKRDPAPATSTASINCSKMPHWKSVNGTKINQTHIFCGEWDSRKNRPKGFHSRPGGQNPASVGSLETSDRANSDGIYGVRWSYAGERGSDKFSTMFPDRCSADQVLASVGHAAKNTSKCPNGAPRWAWCGWSAPRDGGAQYCTSASGKGFTIAGATLNDGRVNTAFPLK